MVGWEAAEKKELKVTMKQKLPVVLFGQPSHCLKRQACFGGQKALIRFCICECLEASILGFLVGFGAEIFFFLSFGFLSDLLQD